MQSNSQKGIWIDRSKAIIISLEKGSEKVKEIESGIENRIYHEHEGDKGSFMGARHSSNEKKFDERKQNQMSSFLNNVVSELREGEDVYILGPAQTKTRLRTLLNEQSHPAVRIMKVETSPKLTPNQLLQKVKQFYNAAPDKKTSAKFSEKIRIKPKTTAK